MSLKLIVSYSLFSLFLFYQQLHAKNFQGASKLYETALLLFAIIGMLFGIGFLLYFGYKVSWWQALGLFGISLAFKFLWFPLEAALGLRNAYWLIAMGGFVAMPVCAYFMLSALP